MTFTITSLYAAVFTVIVIVLANVVSAQRARAKVSILHGDDMQLALWMRRHGNLVENLALFLILLGLCEARGLDAAWLHAAGIVVLVARLAHLAGLNLTNPAAPLRIAGGALTQATMLVLSAWLVWSLF
jgi:uncharacterized protein